MAEMPEPAVGGSGRNPRDTTGGAPNGPAGRGHDDPRKQQLLEEVVEGENMRAAYRQVIRNAGAPGIDAMSVEDLA